MSTHNIQFHDKRRKNHAIFVFLNYWKNFVGTEKRVRIIHGKRAIHVRAIEAILQIVMKCVLFSDSLAGPSRNRRKRWVARTAAATYKGKARNENRNVETTLFKLYNELTCMRQKHGISNLFNFGL